MSRYLKSLCPLIVALALCAALASGAQASEASFSWGEGTTYLKGKAATTDGVQVLVIRGGLNVECDEVQAETMVSSAGGSAKELTTESISYGDSVLGEGKCTGPLGSQPQIEMNGCNYRFHAGEEESAVESVGTMDILCPEGKDIVLSAGNCTIEVGAQSGLGPVVYDSSSGLEIRPEVEGIAYTTEGSACGTHSETNGLYTGHVAVEEVDAEEGSGHFNWGQGGTKFKATQDPAAGSAGFQRFSVTSGALSFTCDEIHVAGNLPASGPATTFETSAITYNDSALGEDKCTGPLGTLPVIELNGCNYRFHMRDTVEGSPDEVTADMAIVCPAGRTITTNGGALCTIELPPQEGLNHVIFRNEGTTPETLTAETAISGIKETHSGLCGNATTNTGVYESTFTVTAEDDLGQQKDITVT